MYFKLIKQKKDVKEKLSLKNNTKVSNKLPLRIQFQTHGNKSIWL